MACINRTHENQQFNLKREEQDLHKGHDGEPHLKGEVWRDMLRASLIVSLSHAIEMGLHHDEFRSYMNE